MDTEMLQLVSDRLRSQSLDEITNLHDYKEEERDSGTESDEELSTLAQDMASASSPPRVQAGPVHISPVFCHYPRPSTGSPLYPQSSHHTQVIVDDDDDAPTTVSADSTRCSLDTTSDCSVDYDTFPADYDLELVELATKLRPVVAVAAAAAAATTTHHGFPSMDKISDCDSELAELLTSDDMDTPEELDDDEEDDRSPINRCGSCGSVSASDDEVRELVDRKSPAPLRFRTSPPRGVHKLNKRTISPKVFLASINAAYTSRFHRHRLAANVSTIQRPHLDFEKMQVTRNTRILYSVV